MKNLRAAGAFLASLFLFSATVASSAAPAQENSVVQQNKEKLLKTKSCPGCNLAGVNLNRADLAGADLQGADLTRAKFFLANLSGANLQKARLQGAGFGGADLADADFRGADLRDISLSGAYYRGAHFDQEFAATLQKGDAGAGDIAAEATGTAEPDVVERKTSAPEQARQPSVRPAEKAKDVPPAPVAVQQKPEATAGIARRVAKQQTEVTGAPDPGTAPQNTIEAKEQEVPEASATTSGEAPPVKTVQPPGAIVIAEQATAGKASGTVEKKVMPEADAAGAIRKTVQADSSRDASVKMANAPPPTAASDPGGGAKVSQTSPADQEKMAKLARLVKSKKCFACDLSGMDLSNMRLAKADLEKADLSDCNLEGADLGAANLKGANLRRANLKKANLKGADLYKADLTAADLSGAVMKKAKIDEALFTGAIGVSEEILEGKN